MSHTPGPWTVAHVGEDHYAVDEEAVDVGMAWGKQVADSIRTEADARLIAAAPELLAALRHTALLFHGWALHEGQDETFQECPHDRCRMNRAVIAKATGAEVSA